MDDEWVMKSVNDIFKIDFQSESNHLVACNFGNRVENLVEKDC